MSHPHGPPFRARRDGSSSRSSDGARPVRPPTLVPLGAWIVPAAIVLAACALILPHLGRRPLWGAEARWAEVTREMLASGDAFRTTLNGEPYDDKPLLGYWLCALSARALGRIDEFAVRLPSALLGILAALLTYLLGRAVFSSDRAGLAAALSLLAAPRFVFWARTATTEIHTLCGTLAATYLFWRNRATPRGPWLFAFFPLLALTSLAKGLPGAAVPLAVVLACAVAAKALPGPRGDAGPAPLRAWANGRVLIATVAGLAIFLAPLVPWVSESGGDAGRALFRENVLRIIAPFDHTRTPWYAYFTEIPETLGPWFVLLPLGAVACYRRLRRGEAGCLLPLVYAPVIYLLFALAPSRRSYYVLPALPGLSLLVAACWEEIASKRFRHAWAVGCRRLIGAVSWALAAVSVLIAVSPIAWRLTLARAPTRGILIDRLHFDPAAPLPDLVPIWLVGGGAAILALSIASLLALRRRGAGRALALQGAAQLAAIGTFWILLIPHYQGFEHLRPFLRGVRERAAGAPLINCSPHAALYFYLRSPVPIPEIGPKGLAEVARSAPEGTLLLISARDWRREIESRSLTAPDRERLREVVEQARPPWPSPRSERYRYLLLQIGARSSPGWRGSVKLSPRPISP